MLGKNVAIDIGTHVAWRWQGISNHCWLTSIEMLMQTKYGSIYGRDLDSNNNRDAHSDKAIEEKNKNKGSHIRLHADHYNLVTNNKLFNGIGAWENALRRGPVLAEGKYGWSSFGWGSHVILIAGVSRTKNLAFFNPNFLALLPHPTDKISYFTLERCMALAADGHGRGGPFWQVAEDIES